MTYAVTMSRVIGSEWTKLRSLRSNWITLGVATALTLGLATAFGYSFNQDVDAGDATASVANAVNVSYIGLDLLALILGVVGVLQISGEYGSGLIRASATAVPRRWPLLAAKASALLGLVIPVVIVVSVGSFLVVQAMLGDAGAGLGDAGVARAVVGATAYPIAVLLIGLSIGALVRHTAAAITVYVTALLVLPALLPAALPERIEDATVKYTPVAAAQSLYTLDPAGAPVELLTPAAGALVLTAWVAALAALATLTFQHRDL
ncbi:ABC transporter permease subunit [Cryptosporangium sp. NPDC048952]|uniref:ABC transporter permease subunit n=1 Tax=Cryptosporangium sp. NPDC048952 TaxID=3363961 RepID=UPI003710657F